MLRGVERTVELLTIDRTAAAEIPSDAAVREWARDKRVFISSVMAELADVRQAAARAVRAVGARPVMFEEFGGRDADAEDAYLAEVETSDIYLGILGRRYGKPLPSRYSATHAEYLHAEEVGLRIAVWTMAVSNREGHQQSFLDDIRVFHVVPECHSSEDLGHQITERLRTIAAEDLAPWCKLGATVFRASEVADRGREIVVTARIRNDAVAHQLEALRQNGLNRGDELRFSWTGRSKAVRVAGVESRTTSARSRNFVLRLDVVESRRDTLLDMSVNGLPPDELTEIALRKALFGMEHPLANQHLGLFAEMTDPLQSLRNARVSDEIVRPLAELVVVDQLVGSSRATRVSGFSLGAKVRSERELSLSWETPRRHTNEPPRVRTVRGKVSL